MVKVAEHLHTHGLGPVFVEQNGVPLEARTVSNIVHSMHTTKVTPCIIVGSESYGIPDALIKMFPHAPMLSIPQVGIMKSLNVAAAAAIVMHSFQDAYRRRVAHLTTY